jgi:hypothetical protein
MLFLPFELLEHICSFIPVEELISLWRGGILTKCIVVHWPSTGLAGFQAAITANSPELLRLSPSPSLQLLNINLKNSSNCGNQSIVEVLVEKGANHWNDSMAWAAYGGHKNLVEYFIAKGANDWNVGMAWARYGARQDLVEYFVARGATDN